MGQPATYLPLGATQSETVCVCVCACVRACVRACVHVHVHVHVHVCVFLKSMYWKLCDLKITKQTRTSCLLLTCVSTVAMHMMSRLQLLGPKHLQHCKMVPICSCS